MRSTDGQIFATSAQPPTRRDPAPTDRGQPEVTIEALPPTVEVNDKITKWFVDREIQRRIFLAMLQQPLLKQIMFVEAPTYMGKTWLINWLLGHCQAEGVPVAHFDFDFLARMPLDYLRMVQHVGEQLGSEHFEEMNRRIADNLAAVTTDSVRIRQAIKASIMETFFQCLGRLSQQQKVVILIDAYESAEDDAKEWIDELLFRIRRERLPRVLLVVAGQDVPAIDRQDFQAFLVPFELEAFECDDVAEYLKLRGLDLDPAAIYDRARGHPRQLSIVVEESLLGL